MSSGLINGIYDFEPLPTQQRVFDAVENLDAPNIMYCSGFGAGKSRLAGEIGLQLGINIPGIEVLFWRKTRSSIEDTTYRIFIEQVVPEEYIGKHNKSKLSLTLRNGARYDFLGMDRVTRKGSYWGDVIILDESIEFEEDELKMIEGRLRGRHIRTPLMIYLTNPGAPGSYQHKLFVENEKKPPGQRDPDFLYFSATSFENIHNPPAYFDRLNKWRGTQYFDRYVLGLWAAFKGVIYEQYDPAVHLIDPFPIPANWPKQIAVDFGYDNPAVVLWIAKDPATGTKYVYRQFYKTHTLVRDICAIGKEVTRQAGETLQIARADHDAENRAQFEQDWMPTEPAQKTVAAGIQAVQEAFLPQWHGGRGLYIFNDAWREREGFWYGNIDPDPLLQEEKKPTCLQEELPVYMWGKDDKPVKENDHACDALRYDILTDQRGGTSFEVFGKIAGDSYSRR